MKLIHRFLWINFISLFYAGISFWLAQWWINDLSNVLGSYFLSLVIVLFVAIIPGYMNILLLATLYFYRYEPIKHKNADYPPINILMAAYNEEDVLRETFRGVRQQNYPNTIDIIVVDDGSTDSTIEQLKKLNISNLTVIKADHGGKASALNTGLKSCKHDIIVTMDADTFLHKNAVKRIVARIMSPQNYAAVAGHILVKNERMSRLTRIQSWDYVLGISAVKIQQGLFEGTLVAQGAFSVFRKEPLLKLKGWKDRIGEDIVLTWALLKKGYRVGYEPSAFAFTTAPLNYERFFRQRERWARGMIEGFKDHISLIWKGKRYSSCFVALNLFFPFIDFFYTFAFLPGIVMACFGYYHIVGLITLLVLPINICIIVMILHSQKRFLRYAGLKIRYNPVAMVLYVLIYQIIMSPICVIGYCKEILRFKRRW